MILKFTTIIYHVGGNLLNAEVRAHIRSLLWQYKKIVKEFDDFANLASLTNSFFMEYPINNIENLSLNQIMFHKMFLQIVNEVLEDSTDDIKNIFNTKYKYGSPRKGNDLVAYETFLSESTVKRRDNEFLVEIANRLGWRV